MNWSGKVRSTNRRTRKSRAKGQDKTKRSARRMAYDHSSCKVCRTGFRSNDLSGNKDEDHRGNCRGRRASQPQNHGYEYWLRAQRAKR